MNTTTRHFEFKDGKSSKFWEITQADDSVTVRYGKTGTAGQSQTKAFVDSGAASKHAQKLIAEKLGKGYVEQGVVASDAPVAAVPTTETPKTRKAASASSTKPAKPVSAKQDPAAVAKDLESTPEQLAQVVGINETIDRLLAKHPKANPQLLEQFSQSRDKTVRKSGVLNANTDKAVLLKLAPQFPEDFFKNPAFDWRLLENTDLLMSLGHGVLKNILKRADCPLSFIQFVAKSGSFEDKLFIYLNEVGPESNRSHLTPDIFEAELRKRIDQIISEDESSSVREALENYSKESLPYALPGFFPQDRKRSDQRRTDMIGGYPYTSAIHPWPHWNEDGLPMQPIAQIDLGRAGELLGADFGSGLAQVWTRVTRSVDEFDAIQIPVCGEFEKGILLRIIPEIDLLNEPIDDFPDFAPWATQQLSAIDAERPGLLFVPLPEMVATPIIRWKKVGQMFYYVDMNIPMESFLEENDPNEESEDSSELSLRFRETANSVFAGPMTNGSLFLGGTGGASGADDPA
jgi:predicted DNA-binding WGR domain protein